MPSKRKVVNFDLDTKALKEFYPSKNWQNAYRDIKRHLLKNDFEWRQGSGYVSKYPMTGVQVGNIINDLVDNNTWLTKCMRDSTVSNADRDFSLNMFFVDNLKRGKFEKYGISIDEENRVISVSDYGTTIWIDETGEPLGNSEGLNIDFAYMTPTPKASEVIEMLKDISDYYHVELDVTDYLDFTKFVDLNDFSMLEGAREYLPKLRESQHDYDVMRDIVNKGIKLRMEENSSICETKEESQNDKPKNRIHHYDDEFEI